MKFIIYLLLLPMSFASYAEPSKKKVGLSVWSGYPESIRGFKHALAEQGYIEGENIEFLLRNASANKQLQQQIATEFFNHNLDLVYSLTTPGTVIIKNTLSELTPIVFSIVTYPADSGLIESFDYSGNNLVGTSNFVPLHHYIDLLAAVLPNTKSVAIFHRKGEPNSKIQATNLARLLKRKNITTIDVEPTSISETINFAKAILTQVDIFITTTDTLMQNGGELALIALSKKHNIPILSSNKKGIEQGSTFGPVADFYNLGKTSGEMAAQILNATAEPHTLMSKYQESPTFLVNKDRMKSLGLTFSTTLTGISYVK